MNMLQNAFLITKNTIQGESNQRTSASPASRPRSGPSIALLSEAGVAAGCAQRKASSVASGDEERGPIAKQSATRRRNEKRTLRLLARSPLVVAELAARQRQQDLGPRGGRRWTQLQRRLELGFDGGTERRRGLGRRGNVLAA
jgi:hypothetical protein